MANLCRLLKSATSCCQRRRGVRLGRLVHTRHLCEPYSSSCARLPQGLYYGFPGTRPFKLGQRLGFYRGTGSISEWHCPTAELQSRWWPWHRLEALDWDDLRLDRHWREHAGRHRGIVILDRRYLDWRYARNPFHAYHLFGVRFGLRRVGWVVVAQYGDLLRCVERILDDGDWLSTLSLLARYGRATGVSKLAWWAAEDAPSPGQAHRVDTGLEGTVVTFSAPEFSSIKPFWQPGDVDIY